ncbi:MAG: hypothetical protein HC771_00245 [Synechococcales cyanobacterium CRU_2_2]|nr:hypothetical protein [Synechococcales cyanobacterium CRU_2_2]
MSQDVTQWLEEIRSLRAQLATVQQERDEAFSESATWRDRLNAEMQLRVRESALLKQQIDTLASRELAEQADGLGAGTEGSGAEPKANTPISAQLQEALNQLTSLEDLREFAVTIAQERDRLRQELQAERQAHQDTRESLSIALGDTIDLLTQRSSSQ